ncbi:hypothetical protein TrVFT333_006467 [Trichoderma virens FT-333]|nr:hypothetical protein TrVFT333_006467 [Trichoderma virens FT-333]
MQLPNIFILTIAFAASAVGAVDFWVAYDLESTSYCSGQGGCTGGSNQYVWLSNGGDQPGCKQMDSARPVDAWDYKSSWPYKFTEILCNKRIDFYNTQDGSDSYDFYYAGGDSRKLGRCYKNITGQKVCLNPLSGSDVIRGIAQCFYDSGASRAC